MVKKETDFKKEVLANWGEKIILDETAYYIKSPRGLIYWGDIGKIEKLESAKFKQVLNFLISEKPLFSFPVNKNIINLFCTFCDKEFVGLVQNFEGVPECKTLQYYNTIYFAIANFKLSKELLKKLRMLIHSKDMELNWSFYENSFFNLLQFKEYRIILPNIQLY